MWDVQLSFCDNILKINSRMNLWGPNNLSKNDFYDEDEDER
jgi:hypothetical protein